MYFDERPSNVVHQLENLRIADKAFPSDYQVSMHSNIPTFCIRDVIQTSVSARTTSAGLSVWMHVRVCLDVNQRGTNRNH